LLDRVTPRIGCGLGALRRLRRVPAAQLAAIATCAAARRITRLGVTAPDARVPGALPGLGAVASLELESMPSWLLESDLLGQLRQLSITRCRLDLDWLAVVFAGGTRLREVRIEADGIGLLLRSGEQRLSRLHLDLRKLHTGWPLLAPAMPGFFDALPSRLVEITHEGLWADAPPAALIAMLAERGLPPLRRDYDR
jgi:hypothetical protein